LHHSTASGGFGLVELLAVSAAGIALSLASYTMYRKGADARDVAQERSNVAALTQNVERIYSGRNAFGGLTTTSALSQGAYPAAMVPPASTFATGIVNVWGGNVSVASATVDGGIPGNGFTITYSNVPSSVCAAFAVAAGVGFEEVTVRSGLLGSGDIHAGSVLASDGRVVDPAVAAQRCSGSGLSTVSFTHASFPLARTTCAGSGPITPNVENLTASCPDTGAGNGLPQLVSDPGPDQYEHTWPQSHSQDGSCGPSGTIVWGAWTLPTPTHDCADQCIPVHSSTTDNRNASCPGGQIVSSRGAYLYQPGWPQTQTTTIDQTCATPIGPLGGQQVNVGQWTPVLTCAPACLAPSPSTSTAIRACPAGQIDAQPPYAPNGIADTTVRTYACSTPIGPLTYTDATTTDNRCAPACVAPAPQTQWLPRSAPCPPGQTGAHTWEAEQARAASCPAPTGPVGPWSAWTDTGSTRNDLNTCATPPPPCVHPPMPPTSQSPACSSGVGSWTQSRTCVESACQPAGGLTTWTCSTWTPASEPPSCAPTCVVPTPSTQTQCGPHTASAPCLAGQTGAHTWRWTQSRSASCPSPTGSVAWTAWTDTTARCAELDTCAPPTCSWPSAPPPPACSDGSTQAGTWVHATCPSWAFNASAPCPSPPTCSWPTAPSSTPVCPSGGNQTGGTWVHGATCPAWVYSGGSCPAPPAPTLYPYCNGGATTHCMSTVFPPPMGAPPAQGGVSAIVNDDTNCCHTMTHPSDWSIGWSAVAGGTVGAGCAASGNGTNNQCLQTGSCRDGYTATATVRHVPSNTTRTYVFTYSCEIRH
jgi:Tfp pilus assembly protein PilE